MNTINDIKNKTAHIIFVLYRNGCYAMNPDTLEPYSFEEFIGYVHDMLDEPDGMFTGVHYVWHSIYTEAPYSRGSFDRLYIGKDGTIKECYAEDIW